MTETLNINNEKINILTSKAVLELHKILSSNYGLFKGMEPITPLGVKNIGLLESAVFRQYTGSGNYYKYNNYYSSCATLTYGIAKNHAFHNGNKRTALLSMIKHLYINGFVLKPNLNEKQIYDLILDIVKDNLIQHNKKYLKKEFSFTTLNDDEYVKYITFWLRKNTTHKINYIASELKMKDFKRILDCKKIEYEEVGIYIELSQYKKIKYSLFSRELIKKKKYKIGKKKRVVKKHIIEKFRQDFNLTKSDGVDNVMFFDEKEFINEEIRKYKSLIYRLSKT